MRFFVCVLLAAGAFAQEPKRFVVIDVDVFDGGRMLRGVNVAVSDGKILAVGKSVAPTPGADTINGKGRTLLPGFVDSHTHMFGIDSLREASVFGVTTELDMFTVVSDAMTLRKEMEQGKYPEAARFKTAGTLVTAPHGHGTEYGIPIPTISNAEEAQSFVDARIAEGSDYIKIIYDDGRTYGTNIPTLSKETLAAVIEAAHKHHKMAVVHIGSYEGAREAITAGADGLMHLFVDQAPDADFGQFVAAHHAFVVPTLSVLASICGRHPGEELLADPRLAPYIVLPDRSNLKKSFPVRANAHENYEVAVKAVQLLKAAKVPILAGTDAPNPGTAHGVSLQGELKLLVDAGLTPADALTSATSLPAARFSMPDRGRVAEGERADLLLVQGDPTKDILATRDIVAVWVGGVQVDRAAWKTSIDNALDAEAKARSAPPPKGAESGLISDFEDGKPDTKFGAAWTPSTDAIAGGKSTAQLLIADDGADGSAHSLNVSREIVKAFAYPWAGAMFMPGSAPMEPTNLSHFSKITFWAKGDGKPARLMVMAKSLGYMPATQNFTPSTEWQQFTFALNSFNGIAGSDVMAFIFSGSAEPGPFRFQIDDVRLQ